MHITFALTAGQRVEFYEPGDFFRLMAATAALNVIYYKNGKEVAEAEAVTVGYAEKFEGEGFDRFVIENGATAQTVTIASRNGSTVQYDTPPNGQVIVTNTGSSSWVHATRTVTTTNSSIANGNPLRRYLLIQNKDATGTIWVTLGNTATQANGIKIEPGGSFEMTGFVTTGIVYAIGDIASNANIIVVDNTA